MPPLLEDDEPVLPLLEDDEPVLSPLLEDGEPVLSLVELVLPPAPSDDGAPEHPDKAAVTARKRVRTE